MRNQCEFCSSFAANVVEIAYMIPKVPVCDGHLDAVLDGSLELPGKVVSHRQISGPKRLVLRTAY